MSVKQVQLWTDGGSRGNPGQAAIGVIIKDQQGAVLWQEGRYLGQPISNNQAEYQALYAGVLKAKDLGAQNLEGFLDSKLVVEQVHGRYKVKDAGLYQWWLQVQTALQGFEAWQLSYVPRAQNAAADGLVNQALDQNT